MFSREVLNLDPAAETARICEAVRAQVLETLHRQSVVVGLSGGVDSSVAGALCARALGKERVLGLFMPERDSSADSLALGRLAAEAAGIDAIVEDIAPALEGAGCYLRQDEAIRMLV